MTGFPIVVYEVTEPRVLFRGCAGADEQSVMEAMRSNYDADRSPHPGERQATVLYMSVSMFDRPEPIERLARRRPDRIGTHVARVELRPGLGLCRAGTSRPGHWSIWGLPRQLADCVIEVFPIE